MRGAVLPLENRRIAAKGAGLVTWNSSMTDIIFTIERPAGWTTVCR